MRDVENAFNLLFEMVMQVRVMPTFQEWIETIDPQACGKIFLMIILLGSLFWIFWTLIRPDTSRKIGVVAFPSTGPYVPFDTSQCGRDVVNCTNAGQGLCDSSCQSSNYACTLIEKGKEVWYLGTKLSSPNGDQSYCLPKQNLNAVKTCGTYTGKAVWNQTSWACQCKYPSLFNGNDCLDQVACTVEGGKCPDGSNPPCMGPGQLKRADGKIWNPNNPGGISSSDNPLDWAADGTPLYQCDCASSSQTFRKPGDPYRCHSNLCYGGHVSSVTTPGSVFDPETGTCSCDNVTTVKSNVTGFCYPIETAAGETGCDPDPLTGNCTCGNHWIDLTDDNKNCDPAPKGFFFRYNSDLYLTWQDPADVTNGKCKSNNCPIYKIRVNDSKATDKNENSIVDHLNAIFADSWAEMLLPEGSWTKYTGMNIAGTMIEFQLMQYPTRSDVNIHSGGFQAYIRRSFECGFNSGTSQAQARMTDAISNQSLAIPCNSFYYNRDGDPLCPAEGCIMCNDPYFSASDLNNKNGSFCYSPVLGKTCGDGVSVFNPFDAAGYGCSCNPDDRSYLSKNTEHTPTGDRPGYICLRTKRAAGENCDSDLDCRPNHHCNHSCSCIAPWCSRSCGGGC